MSRGTDPEFPVSGFMLISVRGFVFRQNLFSQTRAKFFRPPRAYSELQRQHRGPSSTAETRQGSWDRLRLRFRLGLRSRFGFFGSRWLVFLLSWRFRVFRRCGFCFFLLLSRLCFFLLRGQFRCWCGWLRLRLLLHLRDPLVLRKHPVLQIRWNNLRSLRILINLDHAGSR